MADTGETRPGQAGGAPAPRGIPRGRGVAGPRELRSLVRASEERPEDLWVSVRRLLAYLSPFRGRIAVALLWVVVSSGANAAAPALTGRVVDTALGARGDVAVLTLPMLALIATYVIGWLAQRQQILELGTIGQQALVQVRADVFAKVLELSVAFFEGTESGDLMSRLVNDVETINSFLSTTFRRVFGSALGVVATLVGMFVVDWRLALATVAIVPLLWLTTWAFSAIARRAYRRTRQSIGDVSSSLAEELSGIRVSQAFARTAANRESFSERNAVNRDANITASAISAAFSPALGVISTISVATVALLGGWLGTRGFVTIGVVVAFFTYARNFFSGVNQLSSLYADTQAALAGGERIFSLLDTKADVGDAPDATPLSDIRGRVVFDDVRFSYATGPEVLHGLDLVVEPGDTLAVVGPTGAGKSTIVNLIARFYDPTSGAVSVDGHDLRHVTAASLRTRLGLVLQEPFLFAGSIADNIRYGRLAASDSDVRHAAELARAADFIDRLPEGIDTQVGERGALLSTGQRQLIAFARAILADPAILILDEATSSVDTRTEALIQDALRRILTGRTAFVIAHRLSTVRDAGRIVVVQDGAIVETGSYAELLAADGAFARLHRAQFAE
jgi:ATP-binding cassette, subfamily B, multidrug efflux pump